ncbi:MAG TPA: hypothetical protein VFW44_11770 [Bryobacteraceae bacterium]|nr:hypothetical protein [Bryobacteraceae bacterium]
MPDRETTLRRIVARVRCMLPKDWLGRAGKRFRQTTTAISDYSEQHIRLGEKAEAAPELAWRALQGAASEKYARALKDYAEEEKDKLDSELKRRTLESNARQAKATADKLESEARIAQINEMDARLAFFDKLKQRNPVPIWDDSGNMTFARAQKDYDWEGLQDRMLRTGELPKLDERSDPPLK